LEKSIALKLLLRYHQQNFSIFDKETNKTTIYDSINAGARALNIKRSIIDGYFIRNQVKPYKGRYTFKKL